MLSHHPNKAASRVVTTSPLLLVLAAGSLAGSIAAQPAEIIPTRPPVTADRDTEEPSKLASLRRGRDALIIARDFQSALNPARLALDEQKDARDPGYAADLAALARIQSELGEHDDAEDKFLESIELVEAAEGEFTMSLIDPYRGLGRAYIKAGRYPEAITALESAQHVSQRNLGLFNVEQAPLIDDITTAYLGIGDTAEARKLQLERLDNAVRRFGADDPRVVPFRYQLADYYQRSRLTGSAREQYEEVLKSQESRLGATDPGMLTALRQLVRLDLTKAQNEEDDARAKLVAILDANPDIDAAERGLSLATLGDWAIVANDNEAARGYYSQAWAALSSKPDVDVAAFFSKPSAIDFIAPLSSVDRGTRSRPYAWAQIAFKFDVSADGRPLNVETVGRQGGEPSVVETRYNRRLREAHFRPRLADGEPVATSNVQFTHYFRYYVSDKGDEADEEPDEREDGGDDDSAQDGGN
jgi:tetratricopeptide (TPR) repeat protein